MSMLVTTEALSRVSMPVGGSLVTRPEILVRALLRGGTAEQKRRWLPRIASGETMVAIAVTEPDAGSDIAALRCRAIPTIGYRGMHTFELAFEGYALPREALVGGDEWRDRGFYLQLEGFAVGRLQTAGRAIGLTHAALDAALAYTDARRVFGTLERDLPLVQAKIGAMATFLEAARRLAYRAAQAYDEGDPRAGMLASLAKLYASRVAERATRESQQLHGAMGYGEETAISRLFVDARVLAIFEGAEEVLSLRVIGKALLEGAGAS